MNNCLNCNRPLLEAQNFCSHCGQKAALKRLNLHDIWHDMVHYFTHADKGIFQLLKALITQTGTVAREYVSGKRKKYFPPLNFFLIVAALYVFMGSVINYQKSNTQKNSSANTYKSAPPANILSANNTSVKEANVGRFFAKYANFVAMFAAPYISLLIWLIYIRGPFNFTEHLVANLYLIGFTNLIRCLLWIPLLAILHVHPATQWPNYVFALFEISYRSVFYYRFMGKFNRAGKLQSAGVSVLTIIAWWLLIACFIFVYMSMS